MNNPDDKQTTPTLSPSFSVMTYNVGNGLVLPNRLARFVRASDADIIGLQEVDEDQAKAIIEQTEEAFPYRVVQGTGFSGRALLSRFPIDDHEWLDLSPERPDILATIELAGHPTTLLIAHPQPPKLGRQGVVFDQPTAKQIERLAEIAEESPSTVLLGDFNMTQRHPLYSRLAEAGLIDAHRAAGVGGGATFPLRLGKSRKVNHQLSWVPLPPFARVDFIWHSPNFETVGAWVNNGVGSDHRPVLATLKAAGPGDRSRS